MGGDAESVVALSGMAKTHGVWLIGGSIPEIERQTDKIYNTCTVYNPQGTFPRACPPRFCRTSFRTGKLIPRSQATSSSNTEKSTSSTLISPANRRSRRAKPSRAGRRSTRLRLHSERSVSGYATISCVPFTSCPCPPHSLIGFHDRSGSPRWR